MLQKEYCLEMLNLPIESVHSMSINPPVIVIHSPNITVITMLCQEGFLVLSFKALTEVLNSSLYSQFTHSVKIPNIQECFEFFPLAVFNQINVSMLIFYFLCGTKANVLAKPESIKLILFLLSTQLVNPLSKLIHFGLTRSVAHNFR